MAEAFVEWGLPIWAAYLTAALVNAFLLMNVVAVGALIFIWMERKVAGRIQDRLGPTRVGGKFGWLQTLADGIKLVAKEDITPKDADRCSSSSPRTSASPPASRRTWPCRSPTAGRHERSTSPSSSSSPCSAWKSSA